MRLQGKLHFFSQVIIGDNSVKYPSVAGAIVIIGDNSVKYPSVAGAIVSPLPLPLPPPPRPVMYFCSVYGCCIRACNNQWTLVSLLYHELKTFNCLNAKGTA